MGRKFFVGGNWKANPKTVDEANKLLQTLNSADVKGVDVEVVVASPFIFLPLLKDKLRKDWEASAENVFDKPDGAFTGEVTVPMLKSFGVKWTILGHSERRDILKECDDFLTRKAKFAIDNGLKVIYCCGEHLEEREAGNHIGFVSEQIEKMIPAIPNWDSVVIAYEPIWAIGTGKVATPEDAQEMCKTIRDLIAQRVDEDVASKVRILYGGSVNGKNCEELASQPDVDGFLVGGASLKPEFIDIVKSASRSN